MRNKRLEREKAIAEKEKMKNVKKIDSRKSSVADESSLSVKDLDLSINNQDVFSPVSHNTSPPQAALIQPFNYTPKDIQKCLENSMTEPLDQSLNKSLNPALNSSANWSQSSGSGTNTHMTKTEMLLARRRMNSVNKGEDGEEEVAKKKTGCMVTTV